MVRANLGDHRHRSVSISEPPLIWFVAVQDCYLDWSLSSCKPHSNLRRLLGALWNSNHGTGEGQCSRHSSSTSPSCQAPQTTPTGAGFTTLPLLLTATQRAGGRSDAAAVATATLPRIPAGKDSENYLGTSWISFFRVSALAAPAVWPVPPSTHQLLSRNWGKLLCLWTSLSAERTIIWIWEWKD